MAFSLRDFLKKGFLNAVGSLPDYQIMLNAAGWLEKGVLTEDDLAEIQAAIDAQNAPTSNTETGVYTESNNVDTNESEPAV